MFADIALPNAVRQVFTYAVREAMADRLATGMRVWVPLGRRKTIGLVVRLHANKPDFSCKYVAEVLDDSPLVSAELLALTEWVAQYYYAGWGEVLQAALPGGLNYQADRWVSAGTMLQQESPANRIGLNAKEQEVIDQLESSGEVTLVVAEETWGSAFIRSMLAKNMVTLLEHPRLKVRPLRAKGWTWDESSREAALRFVRNHTGKMHGWMQAAMALMELDPPLAQRELSESYGITPFMLSRMHKEGFVEPTTVEVIPDDALAALEHDPARIRTLNTEQRVAYEPVKMALEEGVFRSFLLYGVTGSGKTEVYIHALRDALALGKGGLILVPEIALTPQTVRRFYEIFGDNIAVLHSRLSDRERYEAWTALRKGDKRVAIGARSAVFAPVQDLGIIIMDEEHDASYKQDDPAPRYHAREVAIMRAAKLGIPVVLGSATPNMGSLNGVSRGKHILLRLEGRHEEARLPEVKVLDLRQYRHAMRGPLAVPLAMAITDALSRQEQVILLHNRRGFAAHQQCEACGHVPECPHCSVSLTYHRPNQALRCHYCGFTRRSMTACDHCGDRAVQNRGTGTQRIEEEIQTEFPSARILRMDRDTTSRKDSHARILNSFGRGEADILVGTQLVAKGLDFPNVTVVGVINADTELAFPSYRSSERMFQLLTQVAGRAGRAGKPGIVFLQTRLPEHPSLQFAAQHDFEGFARHEMQQRKDLRYPPFSRMLSVQFKSPDEIRVAEVAAFFTQLLTQVFRDTPILGPAPATIFKLYDDFRWEVLIKLDLTMPVAEIEYRLDKVFALFARSGPSGSSVVRINVNVDV